MFAENLDVFLRDFGAPVVAGAFSCTGILDQPDEALHMGGGQHLSTMYQLTVKSSDAVAGGFARGTALTVNGVAFTVREVLQEDDGAFSKLTLTKV